MTDKLSHLNNQGEVEMVDISSKEITSRQAIAGGKIIMSYQSLQKVQMGNNPKGDVMATAKIAGIMATKKTSNLIPLCHPLPLQKINIDITADENLPGYYIEALVKNQGKTGVEMEALTAVSITALTLYDMIKAIDKSMIITDIKLISKTGGKSDYQINE